MTLLIELMDKQTDFCLFTEPEDRMDVGKHGLIAQDQTQASRNDDYSD